MELGRVTTQHLGGDVWLVTAEGEHDVAVSPGIGDMLDDLERRVGTKIVVDLTPVEFIDSTVIEALVRHADRHDRVVVVVPPGSFARRLFDLVHLEDQLELAHSIDDALARMGTPRDDSAPAASQQRVEHDAEPSSAEERGGVPAARTTTASPRASRLRDPLDGRR